MSHHTSLAVGADPSVAISGPSVRDRLATSTAAWITFLHFVVGIVVLGWLYFVAPRAKYDLDRLGKALSANTILFIRQSDFIVNYWYLFVGAGPILLTFDFLLIRFVGKEIGVWAAIAIGTFIAAVNLAYLVAGIFLLRV